MAMHEILLQCLNELDSKEMGSFKWHLTKNKCNAVPRSELEEKPNFAVVDCMIQRYRPEGAVQRTLCILKKMKQNHLANKLRDKLGPKKPAAKKPTTAAPKKAAKSQKKAKPAKPKAAKPRNTAPKKK